jgi:hypothetical protein
MRTSTWGIILLALCVQVGCTTGWQPIGPMMRGAQEPAGADYLALAASVSVQDNADDRGDLARSVREEFDAAPTASNRLRLAIVQAVPDHPESDAAAAQGNLQLLLSLSDVLGPAERDIARLYLAQVTQQLELESEIGGLRHQIGGLQGDVTGLEARMGRLQGEISRLQAQIDLLTDIERTIEERGGSDADGNGPAGISTITDRREQP